MEVAGVVVGMTRSGAVGFGASWILAVGRNRPQYCFLHEHLLREGDQSIPKVEVKERGLGR